MKIKRYSKAVAAAVSSVVAVLAVHYTEIDPASLESAILVILTAAGVYVAPRNQE